jgi:hypothetical protein
MAVCGASDWLLAGDAQYQLANGGDARSHFMTTNAHGQRWRETAIEAKEVGMLAQRFWSKKEGGMKRKTSGMTRGIHRVSTNEQLQTSCGLLWDRAVQATRRC